MKRISELFNVNTFIVSQVNPHITPFFYEEEIPSELNQYPIYTPLKKLLLSEIQHRSMQLDMMGLLPLFVSKFVKVLTQKYKADVNIVPAPKIKDYFNLLRTEIDDNYMKEYKRLGAKYTFPSRYFIN